MKKLIPMLIMILAIANISFVSAEVGGNITKYAPAQTYSSLDLLLEAEGRTCEVATDGINTIMIENGEATISTLAYPGPNPKYSCTKHITTYTSMDLLLEAEGRTCEVATDGINTIMIENGEATISTRAYPGPNPVYSCTKHVTTYTSMDLLLEAEGSTCEVATDGINSIMIENGEATISTLAYPGDNPLYSCMKEIEKPTMCTMEYMPVCGADGVTYGNSCMAGDTKISYTGECKTMVDATLYNKIKSNSNNIKNVERTLSKVSVSTLKKALERADEIIAATKLSRIAEKMQIDRITKLTFIKHKIEEKLASK